MDTEFLHAGFSPPTTRASMKKILYWEPDGCLFLRGALFVSPILKTKNGKISSTWLEHAKEKQWKDGDEKYEEWTSPANRFISYRFLKDAKILVLTTKNIAEFWLRYDSKKWSSREIIRCNETLLRYTEYVDEIKRLQDWLDRFPKKYFDEFHSPEGKEVCIDFDKVKQDGYDGVYLTPQLMNNLYRFIGPQYDIQDTLKGMGSSQVIVWNWCFKACQEIESKDIDLSCLSVDK